MGFQVLMQLCQQVPEFRSIDGTHRNLSTLADPPTSN
jgi:hypothetical protein